MIAIPAIDLREGACVQLVGGSYDDERIRIPDALVAARQWAEAGFSQLHVVDLDAATGTGSNVALVDKIIAAWGGEVQVGGGVRSSERVRELLEAGASRVVVGTRAIADREWLNEIAGSHPGRIVVAADVRGRMIVTHGWTRGEAVDVGDFVRSLDELPLGAILVTAVHREGRMIGTDIDLMTEISGLTDVPVIASGGITTLDELQRLASRGLAAAVLGMSLYTGALDPRAVAGEFGK